MTLEDLANYCQTTDCVVELGDPESGFVEVNGTGVRRRFNNYRRFLAHHELGGLPSPRKVLEHATVFRVEQGSTVRTLDRAQFEQELEAFRLKVEI